MAVNSFDIGSVLPGLGEALGTGIGTGLQQRMQFNQQARGLQALLGIDTQKAQALSGLPPQYLQKVLPLMYQQQNKPQYDEKYIQEYKEKYGVDPAAPPDIQKAQWAEHNRQQKAIDELDKFILKQQTRPAAGSEVLGFGKEDVLKNPLVQEKAQELGVDLNRYRAKKTSPALEDQGAMLEQPMNQMPDQAMGSPAMPLGEDEDESFGLLKTLLKLPQLVGSGAAQTIGSGLGAFPLANYIRENLPGVMQPDALNEFTQAIQERREPDWNAIQGIQDASIKKMREPLYLPEAQDVKKFIQKDLGVNVTPTNALERIAEKGGEVLPFLALGAYRGASYLANAGLKNYLTRAFGPAAVGEMTKKLTGSEEAGDALSGIGYILSTMDPEPLKKFASSIFSKVENLINNSPNIVAPVSQQLPKLEQLGDKLSRGIPSEAKTQLVKAVRDITEAGVGKKGARDMRNIYQAYRDVGNKMNYFKRNDLGKEAAELRNLTKSALVNWIGKNAPELKDQFLDANTLWRQLSQGNMITENIKNQIPGVGSVGLSMQRILFNILGRPVAEVGYENARRGLRYLGILMKNPASRKPMLEAFKLAAENSLDRIPYLIDKASKAAAKGSKRND